MGYSLLTLLVIFIGFIAIIAAIPQLVRLLRLKSSREFSLSTWVVWLCYQLVSVAYSIKLDAIAFVIINVLWSAFYACMIILIIKYRPGASARR